MTRCATCGTRVDPSRALRLAEGGTVLFFCSPGCRAIYLQRSRRPVPKLREGRPRNAGSTRRAVPKFREASPATNKASKPAQNKDKVSGNVSLAGKPGR